MAPASPRKQVSAEEKERAHKELQDLKDQVRAKYIEIFDITATDEELAAKQIRDEAARKRAEAEKKIQDMRSDPKIAKILDEKEAAAKLKQFEDQDSSRSR